MVFTYLQLFVRRPEAPLKGRQTAKGKGIHLDTAVVLCTVAQLCPTLVTLGTVARQAPLSVGIPQARMLERVAMPSSRGSAQPRD